MVAAAAAAADAVCSFCNATTFGIEVYRGQITRMHDHDLHHTDWKERINHAIIVGQAAAAASYREQVW
jgi:hypothetical protein